MTVAYPLDFPVCNVITLGDNKHRDHRRNNAIDKQTTNKRTMQTTNELRTEHTYRNYTRSNTKEITEQMQSEHRNKIKE